MPGDEQRSIYLRELVLRMGRARNSSTRVYMPAALLAVCDLAAQGKVHAGIVRVADFEQAFERLMLEVLPEREDMWFRPMLHLTRHAMWRLLLSGQEMAHASNRIRSLKTASHYRQLHLHPLRLPACLDHHPDGDALDWHHRKNLA